MPRTSTKTTRSPRRSDVSPSHTQICAGSVGAPHARGPLTGQATDLTSFIGRTDAINEIAHLFDGGARLVTVFGPPGIGKTRLSRRFLHTISGDGEATFFCDLQAARTVEDVCLALGHALDVVLTEATGPADLVRQLGSALESHGHCYVVFDNFEQLVDLARSVLEHWLLAATHTRILVTSRRLLRLTGEHACELHPLSMPTDDTDWDSESMRLFVDRARSVEPAFSIDSPQSRYVAPLVKQLDGIPLAVELAAAQIRRAGPAELLAGLEGFPLGLAQPSERPTDRHATLRLAIDHSWELLTPTERNTLAQLTIFRGGFDRDAAIAVVAAGPVATTAGTAELIARLREASWLRVTADEPLRWDLYEALRAYGAEKLAASHDVDEVQRRHAAHFLEKGEAWVTAIATQEGRRARAALASNIDNLRAAFEWASQHGLDDEAETAARLALVLHSGLRSRMPAAVAEVMDIAIEGVAHGGDRADNSVMARLLIARAGTARQLGDYDSASADLRRLGDLSGVPSVCLVEAELEEGLLHFERGDAAAALTTLETALRHAEDLGSEPHLTGRMLSAIAWVQAEFFRNAIAFSHWDRAISLFQDAGDSSAVLAAGVSSCTFRVIIDGTDVDGHLTEYLARAQEIGDRETQLMAFAGIGCGHLARGRLDHAQPWRPLATRNRQCRRGG